MDLSTSLLKNLTTILGMKSNKNVAGKASNDVIIDYASGDKIMNQCLQPLVDILKKEHCKEKIYRLQMKLHSTLTMWKN